MRETANGSGLWCAMGDILYLSWGGGGGGRSTNFFWRSPVAVRIDYHYDRVYNGFISSCRLCAFLQTHTHIYIYAILHFFAHCKNTLRLSISDIYSVIIASNPKRAWKKWKIRDDLPPSDRPIEVKLYDYR